MPSGFGTYKGLTEWGPFEWPLSLTDNNSKKKKKKQPSTDVFVFFVDISGGLTPPQSSYAPVQGKATFAWSGSLTARGNPNPAIAYKVAHDAGVFVTTTAPSGTDAFHSQVGYQFVCLVFASTVGFAQAQAGAALATANVLSKFACPPDGQGDPPGLLWSCAMMHLPPSKAMPWKMRYGRHLNVQPGFKDSGTDMMVQCYPVIKPYTIGVNVSVSYSGYSMYVYRTDPSGTGQSYGTENPDNTVSGSASIDPVWHQQISSGGNNDGINHGIPFADPPPFIGGDVPDAHDNAC